MKIIEGNALSQLCDYSFGDHHSAIDPDNLPGAHFKLAHPSNKEFIDLCKKFEGKIMTLFIDNIRLYNRGLWVNEGADAKWVEVLMQTNDLLKTCGQLVNNKFIIFTSHEDTPIDDQIQIPDNVLGIHAVNGVYMTDKVHPFPIGLQRPLGKNDPRLSIMKEVVEKGEPYTADKLLYINCGLGANRNEGERAYLPTFEQYDWATCRFDPQSKFFPYEKYLDFLNEMRDHHFIVCPQGHGMDCHRNWETLYLRRVPVMKDHPYFRKLMEGFPVLFVKDWDEITEELLTDNLELYNQAQDMDLNKLDLDVIFNRIMKTYGKDN